MRFLALIALCATVAGVQSTSAPAKPPLVLAAVSLQESLIAAADAWTAMRHERPVLSFGASSALARQVEAGAPADIFISADEPWMDDVQDKGLIRPGTRNSFLGNRLVLVAPVGSPMRLAIGLGFPLARMLGSGRLAMADPDSVPAGRYGRAALVKLGAWASVEPNVVRAENVRAALAFVARGAAAAGVVYETDWRASKGVRLVGVFPADSHPPITYPLALLNTTTSAEADGFRRFLISPAGKRIFERFGFVPL